MGKLLTEENTKKEENETVQDWLNRTTSKSDDKFLNKLKRREKYAWFYDSIFKVTVKYYYIRRKVKSVLSSCGLIEPFYCYRNKVKGYRCEDCCSIKGKCFWDK